MRISNYGSKTAINIWSSLFRMAATSVLVSGFRGGLVAPSFVCLCVWLEVSSHANGRKFHKWRSCYCCCCGCSCDSCCCLLLRCPGLAKFPCWLRFFERPPNATQTKTKVKRVPFNNSVLWHKLRNFATSLLSTRESWGGSRSLTAIYVHICTYMALR